MKNKTFYWILGIIAAFILYAKNAASNVLKAGDILGNASLITSASPDLVVLSTILLPGKPVYSMWPGNNNMLIVRIYVADAVDFIVGSKIKLIGSSKYPGSYLITGDSYFNENVYGPVRDLFLDTQFLGEERTATVVKA